jgi:hypothetical protein
MGLSNLSSLILLLPVDRWLGGGADTTNSANLLAEQVLWQARTDSAAERVEWGESNTSLSRANLQDPAGVPEKIL